MSRHRYGADSARAKLLVTFLVARCVGARQQGDSLIRGGQPGLSAQGRRLQTRPVGSVDRGVSLNRALWMLAEEMRKLKG